MNNTYNFLIGQRVTLKTNPSLTMEIFSIKNDLVGCSWSKPDRTYGAGHYHPALLKLIQTTVLIITSVAHFKVCLN